MDPIDITYNDEVGFLDDEKRDWKTWIMKLLLLAKKEIGKDNNLEMSINFVNEDRSHEINLKIARLMLSLLQLKMVRIQLI